MPNFSWREYGHRVGFWRLMEMLDKRSIKASVTLNAIVGERFPEIIEEAKKRGWEFIAHSYMQSDLLAKFASDKEGEKKLITKTLEAFRKYVGQPAKGWLSTGERSSLNSPEIMAAQGLEFLCDYQNDDQPYPLRVGRKTLISIPYTSEINDYRCIRSGVSARDFGETIRDEFDVLYEEGKTNGRLLNIGLHPHVAGRAHRTKALADALDYVKRHRDVWFALRHEIASWYRKNYM